MLARSHVRPAWLHQRANARGAPDTREARLLVRPDVKALRIGRYQLGAAVAVQIDRGDRQNRMTIQYTARTAVRRQPHLDGGRIVWIDAGVVAQAVTIEVCGHAVRNRGVRNRGVSGNTPEEAEATQQERANGRHCRNFNWKLETGGIFYS